MGRGKETTIADAGKILSPLARFFRLFSDLVSPTNLAIVAGLAVILATGIFGGWEAAEEKPEDLPVFAVDQPVEVNPFALTIHEAFWTSDASPIPSTYSDSEFFVVRATIANSTETWVSVAVLYDAVTAEIPDSPVQPQSGLWSNSMATDGSLGKPTVHRAIDLQNARALQPHLAQDYWLVWELPAGTEPSADVRLAYFQQTWRASNLDGGYFWTDRALAGTQNVVASLSGKVS